jgi:DNA polymerase (family 10)
MSWSNQQVAQVFRDIATTMEALGEHPFKTQAYARAAETIDALPTSLYDYLEQGTLDDIPGVGPAIAAKISELLTTGTLRYREQLRQEVPDGVLEMVRVVPGVGPKTALRFYRQLGITDVAALEEAARNGRLQTLKGVGAKAEARILQALQARAERSNRFLLGEMLPLAHDLVTALRAACPAISQVSYAGSLRRAAPTVDDLNLVAAAHDPQLVQNALESLPHVAQVEEIGERHYAARLHNGKACSLVVAEPDTWGAILALRTGSTAHCERLQSLAAKQGYILRDDGLWHGGSRVLTPTEAAFYAALGLPFIPPELRENRGEIEAAQAGRLPRLVELSDLRADMHTHSEWSDGQGSIAEFATAALARGYNYYVVTDHSLYMGMVNGLDTARLQAQRAEIDAINVQLQRQGINFRLLQGCEVDILPDGSLALPDETLAGLDWVVASLHVSLRQERPIVTKRLLKAIHNPHVDCIGHPTGRILLRRQGADLDMDAVLEAAAETGTVLEVDGSYPRLDLDAEHVQRAVGMGIRIAIDSDAHHVGELANIEYGVLTARRGWAQPDDVVNCWPWEELVERLKG